MQFGWRSPWDSEKPVVPQQEFLRAVFRPSNGLAITHLIGGRGVSKTTSMMMALLESALNVNPGLPHLWSAPTVDDCTTNFLMRWAEHVPSELYDHELSKRRIWLKNRHGPPTPIFYRGRDIANQKKEKGRGPDLAAVFFDELRQDPTDKEWKVILPSVRHPKAKKRIVCTGSTPLKNWYYDVVKDGVEKGHAVEVNGTSWDNPHQDENDIEIQMGNCDRQWARQEHWGEWITLGSQAWDNANLIDDWPIGNMHPHRFDPSLPFTIACDLGVRSGWLIIQHIHGHAGLPTSPMVDVVVGEYTPNDGDTEKVARAIEVDYGTPAKIICGADVNTRNIVNGQTAAAMFRNLGWVCPIIPIKGDMALKEPQYRATKRCLENVRGERTLCISRHLKTHEPHHRGIKEVLSIDAWPENSPRSGEFLPKDKANGGRGLEDIRDAMMYGMSALHPIRGFNRAERAA